MVVTVTVTGVAVVPFSIAGFGETVHVVFGIAFVSTQFSVTAPVNTCGDRLN